MKQKLAQAPQAIASHATNKLQKLINRGSTSIPISKSIITQKRTKTASRKTSRRRRRRQRRKAAKLGLARAIGMQAPVGML